VAISALFGTLLMPISIIAALSENNVIGLNNQLPWRLSSDLKHFKSLTLGKPIVMGRKTFLSLGKALPGRRNIVLTHDLDFSSDDIEVFSTVEAILKVYQSIPELMIIGGAQTYREFLPYVDRLYLTRVNCCIEGDTFFPDINFSNWRLQTKETFQSDEKNEFAFSFEQWEKK
jgi:dihydrofolate reductase